MRFAQNRSARSRSDGACESWIEQVTPSLGEPWNVHRVEALGVLDPVAQPERPPGLAGRREGVEGIAIRAVADRVNRHGPAGVRRAADDVLELLAARDLALPSRRASTRSAIRASRP